MRFIMRRSISILVILFCWTNARAQVTFLNHIAATSSNSTSATTASINTTSCTVAAHCVLAACLSVGTVGLVNPPITDSLNNTWTYIGNTYDDGWQYVELWIAFSPTTGISQNFEVQGYQPAIAVMAFNGVASGPDQQSGASGTGSPLQAGSITPTNNAELVISCFGSGDTPGATYAASSPLTQVDFIPRNSGFTGFGVGSAYDIQTTSAAINATWTSGAPANATNYTISFFSTLDPAPLVVTTSSLPEGFLSVAYNKPLTATGGVTPFTWIQTAGTLPTGLSFSSSGVLSGTPGSTTLRSPQTFQVTDSRSTTASSSGLLLTIAAAQLAITTTTCPGGTQYQAYSGCTIAASGGTAPLALSTDTAPYSYATLPEGMALNTSTGAITSSLIGGQGQYTAGLIVTDDIGATAEQPIVFNIQGANGFLQNIFPSNSIFHHRVDFASTGLPVDTSPAAPIFSGYLSETIKPFFGDASNAPLPNGIPAIEVPCSQAFVGVTTAPGGYQSYFTSAPVPIYAPIEGTANNVDPTYVDYFGDGHVPVYVEAGCGNPAMLYELYEGSVQGGGPNWGDFSNAVWYNVGATGSGANDLTPQGMGTTDAAGLPVSPLLLNADEVIGTGTPTAPNGTVMHPTRFTLEHGLAYWVWPATQTAGVGSCSTGSGGIPTETQISQSSPPVSCQAAGSTFSGVLGEIYRLRASVSTPACAATSPQSAIIITGFRNYGIIFADNGDSGGVIGTPDTRWNDADLACLRALTLADFEPVNVSSLIVSNDSGETGAGGVTPVSPPKPGVLMSGR
jgi:hypothetical protein